MAKRTTKGAPVNLLPGEVTFFSTGPGTSMTARESSKVASPSKSSAKLGMRAEAEEDVESVETMLSHLESGRQPRLVRKKEYVPRQLVVRVDPAVVTSRGGGGRAGAAAAAPVAEAVRRPFEYLEDQGFIEETIAVFPNGTQGRVRVAMAIEESVVGTNEDLLQGINFVRITHERDTEQVLRVLQRTRGVLHAERVPARWLTGSPRRRAPHPTTSAAPVPASSNRQWNLEAIGRYELEPLPNASAVKVSVLDTGIDSTHQALKGVTYFHEGVSAEDIVGHGTHVAGIIAANLNRRNGMQGICKHVDLEARKIFTDAPDEDGDYYVDELMYLRALVGAQRAGAKVINLSIGGAASSKQEKDIFKYVIGKGVTVVAAMGNEYEVGNPTEFPAAYEGVIAVGATNERRTRAKFSNTGSHITLCAPGTNILSTLPLKPSSYRKETSYARWDGTSMATPHVSAAIALLLAKHTPKKLEPADIVTLLQERSAKVSGMRNRPRTNTYGWGLLDIRELLR